MTKETFKGKLVVHYTGVDDMTGKRIKNYVEVYYDTPRTIEEVQESVNRNGGIIHRFTDCKVTHIHARTWVSGAQRI
jgi:hypothetical protein